MQTIALAHISDLHIGPLPSPGIAALAGKRLTGFLSWRLKRSKIHRTNVLEQLLGDIAAQQPAHIAVTGDLVNIALADEFSQAAAFLARLGPPDQVTVVPGNHDAYVPMAFERGIGRWSDYMTGSRDGRPEGAAPPRDAADFPFVRKIGDIALIGLSSALPTVPFSAAGELGERQIGRFAEILKDLGRAGLCRIAMIHHPPFGGGAYRRKSLRDAGDFVAAVREHGCEMVLHGHTHMSGLSRIDTRFGPTPVIGVSSASAVASNHKDPSRYHIYRISAQPDRPGTWWSEVAVRELKADLSGYKALGSMRLELGATLPERAQPETRRQCA